MKRPLIFAVLAVASLSTRLVWAWLDPMHFNTVKTMIYMRDLLCLAPAAVFALLAVHSLPRVNASIALSKHKVVVCFALLATCGAALIAHFVLLGIPAVVDEAAYIWQGQLFTEGRLSGQIPLFDQATLVQYVGDIGNKRVSVFFPGSALPIAVGEVLGARWLVNPILAGCLVLVSAWSARRLFGDRVAVVTAGLLATSPFLLFQGASYFGQVWTALLTVPAVTFAVCPKRRFEPVLVGALLAGALFSRPVSAVVASLVVVTVWVIADRRSLIRNSSLGLVGASPFMGLFLWMNRELTGSWLTTAHGYLLPDDKPVFGLNVIKNLVLNAAGMAADMTGLVLVGAVVLLVAAWRMRSMPAARVVLGYTAMQALAYAFYYNHGISYGPRFLFEVLPFCVMLSAAGLLVLFRGREIYVVGVAALITLVGVVPERAAVFHDRASYMDLDQVEREVTEMSGGGPAAVLITHGEYEFPDPFNEAFVRNGPSPFERRILYLRADAMNGCVAVDSMPDRAVFTYAPVDTSKPSVEGREKSRVNRVEGCPKR